MVAYRTGIVIFLSLIAVAMMFAVVSSWRSAGQAPVTADAPAASAELPAPAPDPTRAGPSRAGHEPGDGGDECADLGAYAGTATTGQQREVEVDLSRNPPIIARLKLSDDPDHRLAAALMPGNEFRNELRKRDGQIDTVAAILERHPDHTLAFWNLMLLCARSLGHPECGDAVLSAQAERLDSENSEVWALLAVYRERRDDIEGARSAMQRAIGSATTTTYYAEQLMLFERAYAAASDFSPSQRMIRAAGDVAATSLQPVDVYNACKRLAKTDILWRRMCFEYGRNLQSRARTLVAEGIGLGLQTEIARMDRDERTLAELLERIENLRALEVYDEAGTIHDDRVNARYLEQLSVHGERAAMAFLREEVERRRELLARCR